MIASYSVDSDGFSVVEQLLPPADIQRLCQIVEEKIPVETRRGGARNLLDIPEMRELSQSVVLRKEVEDVLGPNARVVRGILFDKTEESNWKVPWHQDVTIAVSQKVETPDFGPWSTKAGILHVQPPASVLEKMISVRLHLDDCPAENGALRIIPGSHIHGKLDERLVQQLAVQNEAITCAVRKGDALMMRPLLLHASSSSSIPGHRRVIHLDYAAAKLPTGMNWAVS